LAIEKNWGDGSFCFGFSVWDTQQLTQTMECSVHELIEITKFKAKNKMAGKFKHSGLPTAHISHLLKRFCRSSVIMLEFRFNANVLPTRNIANLS
jgi:hypothetical protein